MSKFELPISQNYVRDWTIVKAVREYFQNALDQETVNSHNEMFWAYNIATEHLYIGNKLSVLDTSSLVLGATTKADNVNTIGQFGEGYKIATLVALREGYNVVIQNYGNKETWTARLINSKKYKQQILAFDVDKTIFSSVPNNNLTIDIWPVTQETFILLKQYNLHLGINMPDTINKYVTSEGNVLADDKYKGMIFVNGLFVAKNDYLAYGYDLPPCKLKLDRDRRLVGEFDIAWATSSIWREAGATTECLALVKNSDLLDCKYLSAGMLKTELCDAVTTEFVSTYGDKAIPVQTQEEVENINTLYTDAKPVIVTSSQQRIIQNNHNYCPNVTEATPGPTFEEKIATWVIEYRDAMSIEMVKDIYDIFKSVNKSDLLLDVDVIELPNSFDDIDCDTLKPYCRVEGPSSYGTPTGYNSCEGSYCPEAYDNYIEQWQIDNDFELKCKHCKHLMSSQPHNICDFNNESCEANEQICMNFDCIGNGAK